MVETRKSKIPAVRVESDGCAIMQGRVIQDGVVTHPGTPIYVHKGEWVEIVPVQSMREFLALSSLVGATREGQSQGERLAGFSVPLADLCDVLSKRVLEWNWTDLVGDSMPQPYKNSQAIQMLSNDELLWLITAAQGETGEQRKNGSTP